MQAIQFIDNSIPYLKTTDNVAFALDIMAANGFAILPLVEENQFLGFVSENRLLEVIDDQTPLSQIQLSTKKTFINEDDHFFELVKLMSHSDLFYVPVIDAQEEFIGIATRRKVIELFGTKTSASENGGIIVLEMNNNDYSLSEIARIVESNDASIISSFLTLSHNAKKLEVHLKINKVDLKEIIKTFERFEYEVKATYHESNFEEGLKERLDSLMHYLDI